MTFQIDKSLRPYIKNKGKEKKGIKAKDNSKHLECAIKQISNAKIR